MLDIGAGYQEVLGEKGFRAGAGTKTLERFGLDGCLSQSSSAPFSLLLLSIICCHLNSHVNHVSLLLRSVASNYITLFTLFSENVKRNCVPFYCFNICRMERLVSTTSVCTLV